MFRAREPNEPTPTASATTVVRVPWHPITTIVFVLACWAVSATTIVQYPRNAGIGVAILLAGVVVFQMWRKPRSPGELRLLAMLCRSLPPVIGCVFSCSFGCSVRGDCMRRRRSSVVRGRGLIVAPLSAAEQAHVYEAALRAAFEVDDESLSLLLDPRELPRDIGLAVGPRLPDSVGAELRRRGATKGACEPPLGQQARISAMHCRASGLRGAILPGLQAARRFGAGLRVRPEVRHATRATRDRCASSGPIRSFRTATVARGARRPRAERDSRRAESRTRCRPAVSPCIRLRRRTHQPLSLADAERFAREHFGVDGRATALTSERDQNFLIDVRAAADRSQDRERVRRSGDCSRRNRRATRAPRGTARHDAAAVPLAVNGSSLVEMTLPRTANAISLGDHLARRRPLGDRRPSLARVRRRLGRQESAALDARARRLRSSRRSIATSTGISRTAAPIVDASRSLIADAELGAGDRPRSSARFDERTAPLLADLAARHRPQRSQRLQRSRRRRRRRRDARSAHHRHRRFRRHGA